LPYWGADVAIQQQITQRSWLPAQLDDETTRLLCAQARLQPLFADEVLASIATQPYRAIAPSYGVDLLALVRHAARTRRTHFRRNLAHTVLLLAGLVMLATIILNYPDATLPLAAIGALALLAWAVDFADLWIARREALELVETHEDPVSLAPPIDPELERRLAKLNRRNVVVYDTHQHFPFVGSGWWVGGWSIPPVDVTKAAKDDHDQEREVVPFDPVQLHSSLEEAVRARGAAGVHVSNRLYVRGSSTQHIRGLLGGQLRTPEPIVDSDVIESALRHPQSTIQTYLCLEKITFGGQLAVSMFVHAQLEHNLLTVRADCFFLPPLRRSFWAVLWLPRRRPRVLAKTAADAVGAFPHDLFAAPGELVRYWLRKVRHRRRLARIARRIKRDRGFDYGASDSIREDTADFAEANHVHVTHEERSLRMLQRHVIDAILQFLDSHNVDISDLRKQQGRILNTNYNFHGPVDGQGHQFGNYGRQTNNPPSPPPGGNPAGRQPGGRE
jgi:hypothetical protein